MTHRLNVRLRWIGACVLIGVTLASITAAAAPHSAAPGAGPASVHDRLIKGELGFTELLVIQRRALSPSHVYTYHQEGFAPGGGLFVFRPSPGGGGTMRRLVDAGQGQILDCDLSWDGRVVLLSFRKSAGETYHVYRINLDGSGLTQLTHGDHANFNACWLPDGDIAFLSSRREAYAYCWISPVGILHRMKPDGSNVVQLSANYLNDFTPTVTHAGEIIYSRWEYVDRPAIPIQSLWTIHPDGTQLKVFFGNRVLSPATFMEPRAVPGSPKILCVMTSHNGPCRGAIGLIDPVHGPNAQAAIENLTPEVKIGRVDEGDGNFIRGPYESPYPIDGRYFLVSRDGTILLRDYAGREVTEVLGKQGELGFYSAQPVRAEAAPPVLPSLLPTAPAPAPADGDATGWATVHLQDVYNGLEPYVKRGEVTQIAVVQEIEKPRLADVKYRAFGFQFPVVSCGATYAPKKVWGYAPVKADGSASFRVPADVPIYFLALDAQGRAVQRMRSFTHLKAGEVHSCVGCHERSYQPPSARGGERLSLRQAPSDLAEPEWGRGGFSYAAVVQPVLDEHCVSCHHAREAGGGVDLAGDMTDFFNVSYEHLARKGTMAEDPNVGGGRSRAMNPYTSWIKTYNGQEFNILQIEPKAWGSHASRLAELILTGHPDGEGKPRVTLTPAQQRRIFAWIDLNVPYYGTSASLHDTSFGCRQVKPAKLDAVLAEVAQRRCAGCHHDDKGAAAIPRDFYVRITNPQLNSFLLAPLAAEAGGTQRCSEAVFKSTDDADYRAILATFDQTRQLLKDKPREDLLTSPPPGCD